MIVLAPNFSGNLNLPIRQASADDYWFVLIDKEANTYIAYDITGATVSDDDFTVTVPLTLTITEGKQYTYYLFTNDGTMTSETGSESDFFEELTEYEDNITEIARGRIFCTEHTPLIKYTTAPAGTFTTNATGDDNEFVINE